MFLSKNFSFALKQPLVKYHGYGFVGSPAQDTWSNFKILFNKKQTGAIALTVCGEQAKNYGRDILTNFESKLPASSEKVYILLEDILRQAQEAGYELAFALALTEGRKLMTASFQGGVYLERNEKRGNLLKPQPKIQFLSGNRYPKDKIWLYTSASYKTVFSLHRLLENSPDYFLLNELLRKELTGAHQVIGLLFSADEFLVELAEAFGQDAFVSPELNEEPITIIKKVDQKQVIFSFGRDLIKRLLSFLQLISLKIVTVWRKVRTRKIDLRNLFWWFGSNQVYLIKHVSKKTVTRVGLFFGLVFLIGVGGFLFFYQQLQLKSKVDEELRPSKEKFEAILRLGQTQPVLAKKQTNDLLKELFIKKSSMESNEYGENQLLNFQTRVEVYLKQLEAQKAENIPIFDDLRRLSPILVIDKAAVFNQKAVFADTKQKLMVFYDLASKSAELVALDADLTIRDITSTATQNIALTDQLIEFGVSQDELKVKSLVAPSELISDASLLAEFKTNLYVFNPVKRNVYRYIEKGSAYSQAVGWFNQASSLDFSTVTSMTVDGDLWLGSQKGEVLRFGGGKRIDFNITGLQPAFHSELQLATATDHEYLYVLEPAENRVVVLDKTGKLVMQISNPLLGSATKLVFSSSEKLMLAISGSVLYQIPL